jgi:hypothetical protein
MGAPCPRKTGGGTLVLAAILGSLHQRDDREATERSAAWPLAAWPPEKGTTPTPVRRNDTYWRHLARDTCEVGDSGRDKPTNPVEVRIRGCDTTVKQESEVIADREERR